MNWKSSLLKFAALSSVLLAAVAGIEQGSTIFFGDLTLAPLLSIISLGILAMSETWGRVLVATPIFAVLSYYLVLDHAYFPAIRALSVVFAGILAAWAAYQRSKIIFHSQEIQAILHSLSIPWVLSDDSGNVRQISPQLCSMIEKSHDSVLGTSYFAIFRPIEGKGEFIRKYLDSISSPNIPLHMTVQLADGQERKVDITLLPLELMGEKRVLTTLTIS